MRKTILLAIIACILGIVILAALAFYIPNRLGVPQNSRQSELFTGFQFQTEGRAASGSQLSGAGDGRQDALPGDTLPDEAAIISSLQDVSTESELSSGSMRGMGQSGYVRPHRILWVGDSRTLGLRDALHKTERDDEDLFVGAVGEGVHWFRDQGMYDMGDAIDQNPDLPVVLNLGVNDPQLIDEYIPIYQEVIQKYPDTDFYILSVNPIDEEFLIEDGQVLDAVFDDINSLNIARMNIRLKEEFGSRYIDSASFLKEEGYETVDGLHYSTQTYLKIHDYVVKCLF